MKEVERLPLLDYRLTSSGSTVLRIVAAVNTMPFFCILSEACGTEANLHCDNGTTSDDQRLSPRDGTWREVRMRS